MDEREYEMAIALCSALSGRLSDEVVDVARGNFFGGEPDMAAATLLYTANNEHIAVTQDEVDSLRALLEDPDDPDLDAVTLIETVPPPAYRFAQATPPEAPDPTDADALISAEAVVFNAQRVQRAWREPMEEATNPATWVYLVQLSAEGDELAATSGMSSRFWVRLKQKWPIEVVAEGKPLTPYQAAIQAVGRQIWAA